MQWIVMKVLVENKDEALATEILTGGFAMHGITGLTIETPSLKPQEGWGANAHALPPKMAAVAYLPKSTASQKKSRTIETHLLELAKTFDLKLAITYGEIDEQDWAESWKAFFWPERISPRMVIKPTWRNFKPTRDDIVIEIDPGMAFGTGTHPTTRMCLNLIEDYIRPADSLLDIGTGSGILMAAAAKLGAQRMTGIDTDEVAIAVAKQNLQLNRIATGQYQLAQSDLHALTPAPFDLITANILWEVIDPLLSSLPEFGRSGTTVIGSGIIAANRRLVTDRLTRCGYRILEIREDAEWLAFAAEIGTRDEVGTDGLDQTL